MKKKVSISLHEWMLYHSLAVINRLCITPLDSEVCITHHLPTVSWEGRVAAIPHAAAVGSVFASLDETSTSGRGSWRLHILSQLVLCLSSYFFLFLSSPSHMEMSCLHTDNCSTSFLLDAYYLCFLFLCPFSHMLFLMIPLAQHNLSPLCYIFIY